MKLRKTFLYFVCFLMSIVLVAPMSACKPNYRNTRKIAKHRKIKVKRHRFAKTYGKKVGKHPVPINTKYIMKTQRRSSYNY
ncbi:MAG: hypothetical protein MJZ76_07905 [Bacteroidales bacterium]|nr:hypothetical protein [Bacteroidales bacterium]